LEDELVLIADATRLRQVLVNLLANAVKYSSAGSSIEVTASLVRDATAVPAPPAAQEQTAPIACIRIRDHGLGVPPEEQRKLFQRFVRLERDITGPVRGTGIGLFTCRTLVEAMGGASGSKATGYPDMALPSRLRFPSGLAPERKPAPETCRHS
jgi:signal transduction histidine kinase